MEIYNIRNVNRKYNESIIVGVLVGRRMDVGVEDEGNKE